MQPLESIGGGGFWHFGFRQAFSQTLIMHFSGLQLTFIRPEMSAFPPVTKIASEGGCYLNGCTKFEKIGFFYGVNELMGDFFTMVFNPDTIGHSGFYRIRYA